jgi:predicted flap endonuclease-1-like 5' DNA nuclease
MDSNKGFSLKEIQLAGFKEGQLKEKKVKIDYRRKSFTPENLKKLSLLDIKPDPQLKELALKKYQKTERSPVKRVKSSPKPKTIKKEVKVEPVKKVVKKTSVKVSKKTSKKVSKKTSKKVSKKTSKKISKKTTAKATKAPVKNSNPEPAAPKAKTATTSSAIKDLCDLDKITSGMEKKLNEAGVNSCEDLLAIDSIEQLRAVSKSTKITQKQIKAWKAQIAGEN